ncbi:uncharacterized protein LOC108666746 [Hyalella azteca]|uniref:Uncharacterized protein LOC108666746 n=1 Tax=Hyalella azteca TaxID=294128 RepID=A0A8B7N5M6_HYAAZ|nr:uncharacterized protein LOC108666746 [Hyalella azteca]
MKMFLLLATAVLVVVTVGADTSGPLKTLSAVHHGADVNGAAKAALFRSADTESIKHNSLHMPDDDSFLYVELLEATMDPDYGAGNNTDDGGITAGGIASIVAVLMVILAYAAAFLFHVIREKLYTRWF